MENTLYPLVLGADWIAASGISLTFSNGTWICEIAGQERKAMSEKEPTPKHAEPPPDPRVQPVGESVNIDVSTLGSSHGFEQAVQKLRLLGSLIWENPNRRAERAAKLLIRPTKTRRIPGANFGFIEAKVPADHDGLWMLTTTGSSRLGKEWISPSCLLKSEANIVRVPVLNIGTTPFSCSRSKGRWSAVPVSEDQVLPFRTEESSLNTICLTRPFTEDNDPMEGREPKLDDNLTEEQVRKLKQLLAGHSRCFDSKKGRTHLAEHRIETGDARPIHSAPYRVSEAERRVIRQKVEDMMNEEVVVPAFSPWSSPVVLIKKKNGDFRFCVDYRRLNAITQKDVYPLPRIEDVLDRLTGAKYFSSLDLESGFWQLPVAKEHQEKTAFVTPDGLFQFTQLPFGLCGAPPTFQRLMDRVLEGMKWTDCLVYMDDILVFGGDFEQHNQRLNRVLEAIGDAGLTLNVQKCIFGAVSVSYLGHRVSFNGISPDPAKIDAVANFPTPETTTQLRAFLGLASYYRRFIRGFAGVARPLNLLLKKDANVATDWTLEHDEAMLQLKKELTTAPVLVYDDGTSDVELFTDASSKGIGAVLVLKRDDGDRPITFISRRLSPAEENYHANELECLALVWALNKLRHHVYGRRLLVKTDSNVLRWLYKKKDVTGKFARWLLTLQEYSLDIQHLSGTANVVADALSRSPVGAMEDTAGKLLGALQPVGYSRRQIALLQHADKDIRSIVLGLQGFSSPDGLEGSNHEKFVLDLGILYKKSESLGRPHLLVVPSILRKELLNECHDAPSGGHHGRARTLSRLAQRYWWKGMQKSVDAYVGSCDFCQAFKPRIKFPAGKLCSIRPPKLPFQLLGIDHLGPFKTTAAGAKHIVVCIDYLTRWVIAKAVTDTGAEQVCDFLREDVFLQHGTQINQRLVSDQGAAFTSALFAGLLKEWRVKHSLASAEHPETNGLVEKANGTLTSTIAAFVNLNHTDWDLRLAEAIFAINTAKHFTTEITPFELVFGRTAVLPHESAFPWPPTEIETNEDRIKKVAHWRRIARQLTIKQQKKSEATYNKYRSPDPIFSPGELVLVARKRRGNGKTKKFLPRFIGPYQIVKRVSRTCYLLEDIPANRRKRIWRSFNAHSCQLRRYSARVETEWTPEAHLEDDLVSSNGEESLWESETEPEEPIQCSNDPNSDADSRNNETTPQVSRTGHEERNLKPDEGSMNPEMETLEVFTRSGRRSRSPAYLYPIVKH